MIMGFICAREAADRWGITVDDTDKIAGFLL